MPVNIFTTIDDPVATQDTDPFGINGSGQIVGAFRTNSVFHGFVLSGGSFTTLDAPLAQSTQAFGINDAGQIVGFFSDASTTHGFLLSGGTFIPIDDPSAGPGTPRRHRGPRHQQCRPDRRVFYRRQRQDPRLPA